MKNKECHVENFATFFSPKKLMNLVQTNLVLLH